MIAARRTQDGQPMLIVQVDTAQDEKTGDFYYRTYAPGVGMARCPGVYVVNLTNIHRCKEELMRAADVLVLNNLCDPDILPLIRDRKQQGRPTIYELCDDLDAVPPGAPVHAFYNHPENRLLIKRTAHYSDAMQFSSPELAGKYGALNSDSSVFPNQILEVPPERRYTRRTEVAVGWGGSLGHLDDMAKLAEPLIRWVLSRQDVQLHLMCADPIWELFHLLPPHRRKRTQPGSLQDYYRFLSTIDIGLAPLEDTAFNRSRSDVKFLEYAVHGVVPVVQATGPYLSVVRHGETGYLFRTTEDLLRILGKLVDDISARVRTSVAARDYILRERLQIDHGGERVDFYRGKLDRSRKGENGQEETARTFERFASIPGAERKGRHLFMASTPFELLLRGGMLASDLAIPEKAAHMFTRAAQLVPQSYLPHMFGAYCSGNTLQSLEQAVKRNPLSIKARILLGEEYVGRGEPAEALKCFQAAAEIFPDYELPFLKVASLLKAGSFHEESLSFLRKARSLIAIPAFGGQSGF